MKPKAFGLSAIAAAAFVLPALAQPSPVVVFDQSKIQTLTGTVQDLDWMNPKSVLSVTVKDPKTGEPTKWAFQLAAPERAIKSGWMHNSLKNGDQVTLTMHPARDGSHVGQLVSATLPDGSIVGGDEPVKGGKARSFLREPTSASPS
jgi:hypothetical protein